jgi:hypothetical protein
VFNEKLINSMQDEIKYLKQFKNYQLVLLEESRQKELFFVGKINKLNNELNEKCHVADNKYEEKISKLEYENKFLTEINKELIKSLVNCSDNEESNKNETLKGWENSIPPGKEFVEWFTNVSKLDKIKDKKISYIENIEWISVDNKPEKEGMYLVRHPWLNSYSIEFIGYNYDHGWSTHSNYVITHWAKVKGPSL